PPVPSRERHEHQLGRQLAPPAERTRGRGHRVLAGKFRRTDPIKPEVTMPRHTTVRDQPLLVRAVNEVERAERLDPIADRLQPVAPVLVEGPRRRRVLLGHDLGHALHAPLTDVPVGSWLSAAVLDMVGGAGAQPAARRLLGVGLLAALPTAVSGWAEWVSTEGAPRRVGLVH